MRDGKEKGWAMINGGKWTATKKGKS